MKCDKNIQLHLHTSELKSLLRSWAPNQSGEDLSQFRPSIKDVTETKKDWAGFEVGTVGLAIPGAVPVSSQMLTYLGQTAGKHIPFDLSKACRRFLPLLKAAIPTEVNLQTDLPVPGPIVNSNVNQLQLVVSNLTTNAWESAEGEKQAVALTVSTLSPTDIPEIYRWPVERQHLSRLSPPLR